MNKIALALTLSALISIPLTAQAAIKGEISYTNDLEVLGRLVANPNFMLARNSTGLYFTVAPNGSINQLPIGTDVAALVGNSSAAALSAVDRAAMFNPNAAPNRMTPMTFVHTTNDGNIPRAMGTRSVYTQRFPTYVSGQVVSEYTTHQQQIFARVIPRNSPSARKPAPVQRKF